MTISFTQTAILAVCGAAVYCSANSLNSTTSLRQATVGGIAGATQVDQPIDILASTLIAVFFECIVGTGTSWDAGTWTVNLNVTTGSGDSFITWDGLDICRINSSCVNQASIASASALNIPCFGAAGIRTTTVSGSAQTPSAGDKVMVLLAFSNTLSGVIRNFGYTPNATIDSPFSPVTTPPNSLMLTGVGI